MELETAIRGRRSIRKFTDRPVTREVLTALLDTARWSPSWANTQGWSVYVVTGEALAEIKAAHTERVQAKAERHFEINRPHPDWPPEMAARTRELYAARASVFPPDATQLANAALFGAPCLLLFAIDARLQPEYACFDSGLLVQSVCLAAHGCGLGTCIMAMAVAYPEVLHRVVREAEGQRFLVGVALGYPDTEAPVNTFARTRAPLDEFVTWVDGRA